MSENCAVPLCLPNNCKWDEQTGEYSRDEEQERTSLCVIDAALERLRNVKGKLINGKCINCRKKSAAKNLKFLSMHVKFCWPCQTNNILTNHWFAWQCGEKNASSFPFAWEILGKDAKRANARPRTIGWLRATERRDMSSTPARATRVSRLHR